MSNKPNPELQAILDRQEQQISSQKADQLEQQMQSSMGTQASQLFAAWVSPNQQYVVGNPDRNTQSVLGGGAVSIGTSHATPVVKAGTIMYAVLLTAVNSDEPGPVLAEIVQGKFKGARLMGTLSNQGQKVLLSFNTLTLPKLSESIAINTVAIDENTTRTALSSDTNNHYWLRYGTLFASAFIQGYGQSFINSAPNYNLSLFGPPTPNQPTQNNLSPRDRVFVGLGQVGLQYSSVLRDIFNTPPTVKVFSGTPMGILFLSDLAALPTT
jgi:intracellular multiplication protein IcmE